MERETENYNNENEDIEELSTASVLPAVTETEGTPKAVVSKTKPPTRQHKKLNEVNL